jgi:hypothetical protein
MDEVKEISKEAFMAYPVFGVLSRHLPGRTEEKREQTKPRQ